MGELEEDLQLELSALERTLLIGNKLLNHLAPQGDGDVRIKLLRLRQASYARQYLIDAFRHARRQLCGALDFDDALDATLAFGEQRDELAVKVIDLPAKID